MYLSYKLGLGILDLEYYETRFLRTLSVPHQLTLLLGKRRAFFESGLKGSFFSINDQLRYQLCPIFGYRHQPLTYRNVTFGFNFGFPIFRINQVDNSSVAFRIFIGLSI